METVECFVSHAQSVSLSKARNPKSSFASLRMTLTVMIKELRNMEISTSFDAGRLTVYISGELDHHEARCAMLRIDELLDAYMPRE